MNNLHRGLAPISDAAWSEIEEETSRTIKRYLAGRRVVDVQGPGGIALSAVGTGHLRNVAAPQVPMPAQEVAIAAYAPPPPNDNCVNATPVAPVKLSGRRQTTIMVSSSASSTRWGRRRMLIRNRVSRGW